MQNENNPFYQIDIIEKYELCLEENHLTRICPVVFLRSYGVLRYLCFFNRNAINRDIIVKYELCLEENRL